MASIDRYLRSKAHDLQSTRPGVWRLSVDGVLVLLVAESSRVRILAPIFAMGQLDMTPRVKHAVMVRLLQSNFERSIDARYALFDGIVFATVTHPRATLQQADLGRFLTQVVNLHKNTFRTGSRGYSSATPDPKSPEVDPRQDDSLMVPDTFERKAQPRPRPKQRERRRLFL